MATHTYFERKVIDRTMQQQQPSAGTQTPTPVPSPPGSGGGSRLGTTLGAIAVVIAIVALAVNLVVPGPSGATGASYTVKSTLPLGQNESGVYAAWGGGTDANLGPTIDFQLPLSAALPEGNVTFIAKGGSYTTACPGPGSAATGQLCVYEAQDGDRTFESIFNPSTGIDGASQYGFSIWIESTGTAAYSYGTWTVAAP